MIIAAWTLGSVVCLAALADDPAKQPMARPEPPVAPDEWTTAIPGKVGLWQVVKGEVTLIGEAIHCSKGETRLRTEHAHRNFTLSFNSSSTGSGFCTVLCNAGQEHGPKSWEYRPGEGPEGANSVQIEVEGQSFRTKVNGKVEKDNRNETAVKGFIEISVRVGDGSSFSIRDLTIVEKGYRPLFNGRDLEGWTGGGGKAEDCWKVSEGLLQCTGAKGPWLKSNEEFGDFNLRLEYRLPPAGNSGVYVRVPPDGNHHGPGSGVEIQVLDDAHKSYAKLQKYQYTGSVYAVAPATQRVARPAGEWNSLEINCKGQTYRVVHNGVTIVEADENSFPALKERRLKGFFGLQNHSSVVSFRNIRLGPPE